MHAIPGAGSAQLHATSGGITQKVGQAVAFGDVGRYASIAAGAVTLEVRAPGGGTRQAKEHLRSGGRYTVVALGGRTHKLDVLAEGRASAGTARLRVVQAAPELGAVDIRLGDRRVAKLSRFGDVAPYTSVDPGAYAVRVTRPSDDSTLAARGAVPLTAGTSSTAFVVGTAGEPLRVVVASDRAAAPRGAPATGLGGLADDGGAPVLLALLAALAAALAGGSAYLVVTGRSRGRGP